MMRDAWLQTNKALRYLHGRGVVTAPDVGYSFIAGGASEKMQQHVARVYPLAAVRFVDRLLHISDTN